MRRTNKPDSTCLMYNLGRLVALVYIRHPLRHRDGAKRRPRLGGCLRKAQARKKPGPMWMGNSKAPGLAINQIVSDCTYEEG